MNPISSGYRKLTEAAPSFTSKLSFFQKAGNTVTAIGKGFEGLFSIYPTKTVQKSKFAPTSQNPTAIKTQEEVAQKMKQAVTTSRPLPTATLSRKNSSKDIIQNKGITDLKSSNLTPKSVVQRVRLSQINNASALPQEIYLNNLVNDIKLGKLTPSDFSEKLRPIFAHMGSKVQISEYLKYNGKQNQETANLTNYINLSNSVSSLAVKLIMDRKTIIERQKMYNFMIEAANAAIEQNNFFLASSILSGLNKSQLTRLKETTRATPDLNAMLGKVSDILSPTSNFKRLLEEQKNIIGKGGIPSIIPHLKSFVILGEVPDLEADGSINQSKKGVIDKLAAELQSHQSDVDKLAEDLTFEPDMADVLSFVREKYPESEMTTRTYELKARGADTKEVNLKK